MNSDISFELNLMFAIFNFLSLNIIIPLVSFKPNFKFKSYKYKKLWLEEKLH